MMQSDLQEEFERQFDELDHHDQLLLIEKLVRRIRRNAYTDPREFERQMEEMSRDPDIRRELGLEPLPSSQPAPPRPDVA